MPTNIPKPEKTRARRKAAEPLIEEVIDDATVAPMPEHDTTADGRGEIVVQSAQEYVAGNGFVGAMLAYNSSLPPWIDDVSRDFGSDIYDRMSLDAHIAGETLVYTRSVLSGGVRLLPVFNRPHDSTDVDAMRKHEIAKKICSFCQRCLDELDTPLHQVLQDMLWAFATGHRVAEIVWRLDSTGYLMPYRIKVKPREATAFVVDNRSNVIGLLGAIAGQATVVVSPNLIVEPGKTANLIPRRKFSVLTWRPKNSDPRGTSAYRPAYNSWWQKRQSEVELSKYIVQFAGAMLVGTTHEKAMQTPLLGPDGAPVMGANGQPVMVDPTTALLRVLEQLRNGGVAALPYGSEVKNLVAIGAGQPFFANLERLNGEISKTILGTTLTSNESRHQTRAATGSHKDVTDLLIEEGEIALASMLSRDLLREAVRNNFGEKYLPFVPVTTLSAAEEADVAELLKAYVAAGYAIAPEHYAQIDSMVKLTPRKDDEEGDAQDTDDSEENKKSEEDKETDE